MNSILSEMLRKYETNGITDKKNAIKEIMQEIVLCGLSRAGFFQKQLSTVEQLFVYSMALTVFLKILIFH